MRGLMRTVSALFGRDLHGSQGILIDGIAARLDGSVRRDKGPHARIGMHKLLGAFVVRLNFGAFTDCLSESAFDDRGDVGAVVRFFDVISA